MGIIGKLAKHGAFGLAGMAAANKGGIGNIARHGGFGIAGMLAAKKKRSGTNPRMEPVSVTGTEDTSEGTGMRKGGKVKKMAGGGSVSKRADGIAQRGKTRGKIC